MTDQVLSDERLRELDPEALEIAARMHDYWTPGDTVTIGQRNATRNAGEIVTAYLAALSCRAAEQQEPEKPFGYDNATGKTTVTDKWRREMDALRPASPPLSKRFPMSDAWPTTEEIEAGALGDTMPLLKITRHHNLNESVAYLIADFFQHGRDFPAGMHVPFSAEADIAAACRRAARMARGG